MGTGGCLSSFGSAGNMSGVPQRYGQYVLQFFDANGNADGDAGDEDADGTKTGDDDDDELGM